MSLYRSIQIFKAKRINTAIKYSDSLRRIPAPLCGHWRDFAGYQNSLDTKNQLTTDFINKTVILEDDLSTFCFDAVADNGTDFQKTLRLMQWLTDHTYYSGMSTQILNDKTSEILKVSVDKGFKYAINCRFKAIALTDMLLSIGIRAVPLLLLGITPTYKRKPTYPNHFMVHVYLKNERRWLLADPSFNVHFTHKGNLLDIIELSELLSHNVSPDLIGYNLNGSATDNLELYKELFLKSCIEFIFTWDSGKRSHDKLNGCQFDYILEPRNCSLLEALKKINAKTFLGEDIKDGYPQRLRRINIDDLLNCAEHSESKNIFAPYCERM